ncbi:MAG: hypothetical protein MUE48_09165, partial [Desulfobacterales bacterium]|nr:hypothetical protein [Desulfobacterales bacterium]
MVALPGQPLQALLVAVDLDLPAAELHAGLDLQRHAKLLGVADAFDVGALNGVEDGRVVGVDLDPLVLGAALGDAGGARHGRQSARLHVHARDLDPPDRLEVAAHGLRPTARQVGPTLVVAEARIASDDLQAGPRPFGRALADDVEHVAVLL